MSTAADATEPGHAAPTGIDEPDPVARLRRATAALAERTSMVEASREIDRRLAVAEGSLKAAADRLQRERKDVSKLQARGIPRFVADLRGNRRAALETELQEQHRAEQVHTEALRVRDELAAERSALRAAITAAGHAEQEYSAALAARQAWLLARPDRDPELARVVAELARAQELRVALEQALATGTTAVTELGRALRNLREARDWATADIVGGGMFTDSVKESRMREAARSLQQAARELNRFGRDVAATGRASTVDGSGVPALDSRLGLADVLFDNVFSDLATGRRIDEATHHAVRAQDDLNRELRAVKSHTAEVVVECRTLSERRKALVSATMPARR